MKETKEMHIYHTQKAWEDLDSYVGEYREDFDMERAFSLLYEYVDEWRDYVVPTGADIVDVLQECEVG